MTDESLPQGNNPALDRPPCRLGVNIDHVATLRNARGGHHPDPIAAAQLAVAAGADGITAHLREDRRHIRDEDIQRLMAEVDAPLNFEMAVTSEMLALCLKTRPHAACLVPENRTERTTEGGLDVIGKKDRIAEAVAQLSEAGIRASLFIDPTPDQVQAAAEVGAPVIELHTGEYHQAAEATDPARLRSTWAALNEAANLADEAGLEVHAGHGLTFQNVSNIASIPAMRELNIGHFLMGESVFMGLHAAIKEMKRLISDARSGRLV